MSWGKGKNTGADPGTGTMIQGSVHARETENCGESSSPDAVIMWIIKSSSVRSCSDPLVTKSKVS